MARKDDLNAAFSIITGDQQQKAKKIRAKSPLGVVLPEDQIARLDEIATELNCPRHQVMQYAISDFIRRWMAGERPKTRKETVIKLDI
jgi:hypothetical protein